MIIKNIELKNNLILAPMAGVSDVAFRSIAINYGADYAETEMISAKALMYKNQKTIDLLFTALNENIKVVQIFGHEPEVMAMACKSEYLKKFDMIDINMGCPAPKIFNNGDGSALLKNFELAEKIIESCANATDKPIIVKFRIGVDEKNLVGIDFAKMCEKAGAAAIAVHGRTTSQQYSGEINYDYIKEIVESVNIPVIGNGNVVDYHSYLKMLSTNCHAVMIGRGALGNPKIFYDILNKNQSKQKDREIVYADIINHVKILRSFYPDRFVIKHMKKHFLWYLNGIINNKEIKLKVCNATNLDVILDEIKDFLMQNN